MATIYQGEDKTLSITVTGFDLQSADEITIVLQGARKLVELTLSNDDIVVVSGTVMEVTIPDTVSETLLPGLKRPIEFVADVGDNRKIAQSFDLDVIKRIS